MMRRRVGTGLLVLASVVLVAVEVPLTLRRPLTADSILFDLEWRTLTRGGLPYRDIFETNPPGTLWIHGFVRSVLGTGDEALRGFDLAVMTAAFLMLGLWSLRLGAGRFAAWILVLVLFWTYASQSIWCQCQRDGWILAISLAALELRWSRAATTESSVSLRRRMLSPFFEGCVWGCAVWIKPFVMIPGMAVWLVGQSESRSAADRIRELVGLFAGGLLVGGIGIGWMIAAGLWPHFLEVNTEWNGDYFASRRLSGRTLLALAVHFGPLVLLIPLALGVLWMWSRDRDTGEPVRDRARRLFAAFFWGWTAQAILLQHPHAYVHLPGLLVAATIAGGETRLMQAKMWIAACVLWVAGILFLNPLARFEHVGVWRACVGGPVTPELRVRVRGPLDRVYPSGPDLPRLAEVEEFLRLQDLDDGELTSYGFSTMSLYRDLDLQPSCRFICPRIYANRFFIHRRDEIAALLAASRQRFVVTDLVMDGFSEEEANAVGPGGPRTPPPTFAGRTMVGVFPWSHRVVFRAGRYLVHEIQEPMGHFTSRPPRSIPDE